MMCVHIFSIVLELVHLNAPFTRDLVLLNSLYRSSCRARTDRISALSAIYRIAIMTLTTTGLTRRFGAPSAQIGGQRRVVRVDVL